MHHHYKSIKSSRTLLISLILIGIFTIIETIGGIMSKSVVLLADASHMSVDFIAILLSWIAIKYKKKPPDNKKSYGYVRLEIIVAFINGMTLFAISVFILITAIQKIISNVIEVHSDLMIFVSFIGIIMNLIILIILHCAQDKTLNFKSTVLHLIGDLLGFIAAFIGGIIIKYTGIYMIDPILSIIIVVVMLKSSYHLISDACHILMEGAPQNITKDEIKLLLKNINGIAYITHIHLWLLTDDYVLLTLKIAIKKKFNPYKIIRQVKYYIKQDKRIDHFEKEILST